MLFTATICLVLMMTLVPDRPSLAAGPGTGPVPGRQTLDQNGRMRIGALDRCPVCGMKVADYVKFSSAIQLSDNTTHYFCSSGCLLRAWLHPDIFLASSKEDLKTAVVREYFTGDQLDGRSVFWVIGSDVIGPMGPALVPVKGEKALETFKRRHGFQTVFLLEELDPEKWFTITGRKAAK
jgi:nitrous oxide reductase accessory protein NosL